MAFRTLGCKVNRVESETIAAELLSRGGSVGHEDTARVVVISTCTVTGEADAKARQAVRHALRSEAKPVVVVTGCGAALDPEMFSAIDERVVVVADKSRVPDVLAGLVALDAPARRAARSRGKRLQDPRDAQGPGRVRRVLRLLHRAVRPRRATGRPARGAGRRVESNSLPPARARSC